MQTIQCIIIDDEPLAHVVIKEHMSKVPYLALVNEFTSAFEALTFIKENKVDLIFLDIQMPEINGIQFIKLLQHTPYIIFTTSSPEYAVESYELNVLDYLLKPISFERFIKGINKIPLPKPALDHTSKAESDYIFVKTDYKSVKINLKDIFFIEGLKENVVFHLESDNIISHLTMKNIEEQLPSTKFVRVHKSFIISMDKIICIERNQIQIKDNWIPVGNIYKENFDEILRRHRIE